MVILKILRAPEWKALQDQGETRGAPIDVEDGYIHFSTAEQAAETAAKHFAGAGDLVLVGVESDDLGNDLKWEVSRGGQLFPHLYRKLRLQDVLWSASLPSVDGRHHFPDNISAADE